MSAEDPWAGDGPPAPVPPGPDVHGQPSRPALPLPDPHEQAPGGATASRPPPPAADGPTGDRSDEPTGGGPDRDDPVEEGPAGPSADAPPPRWLLPLVAAATVLLVVGVTLLGLGLLHRQRTDRAGREGVRAATAAAAVLLSYDYRHLDTDFARGAALSTGGFRRDYLATTAKVVGPTALQYHAVVVAEVAVAGLVSAHDGEAVVLLFVNQTTMSTRVTGQKLDLNRVRMTVREVGGRWLVAKVDAL